MLPNTLPTNSNLYKWGKHPSASCYLCQGGHQSLLHILNDCPAALALRRYAVRHDDVLKLLVSFIHRHLPPSFSMTADLPDQLYSFPQEFASTNLRPDIVWWSKEQRSLCILELTVSFETVMARAHNIKMAKYQDLVDEVKSNGYQAECKALEIGARGLLDMNELLELRCALNIPAKSITELAVSLSRSAILGSFKIWCSRNFCGE